MRRWLPALAWASTLFYLSSRSSTGAGGWLSLPGADKVAHAVAYAVLGTTLAYAAPRARVRWLVLAGIAYGASDELHQGFVPGRDPSVLDLAADAFGSWLGVTLMRHRQAQRTSAEVQERSPS